MTKVMFELGTISPRAGQFDHHGAVAHSDGFVVKMASAQLIEWAIITGADLSALEIEVNHCGHLDDMVAFAAAPAVAAGKLRSLYRLAVVLSVVDSCGPSGYWLVQRGDKAVADAAYAEYHRLMGGVAKELGCQKWQVPLDRQIECSKAAAKVMVDLLAADDYEEPKAEAPPEGSFEVVGKDEGIWLVKTLDSNAFNAIRFSAYLYAAGARAFVSYFERPDQRREYTVAIRSAYDGDLSGVWPVLAAAETVPDGCRNWGGHSGAGGAPMRNEKLAFAGGSALPVDVVYDRVKEALR